MVQMTFTGTPADAYIVASDTVWSEAQAAESGAFYNTSVLRVGAEFTAPSVHRIYQTFLEFDTSAISAGSTINSVVLSVYSNTGFNVKTSFTLYAAIFDWGNFALSNTHYRSLAELGSLTAFASRTILPGASSTQTLTTGNVQAFRNGVETGPNAKTRIILYSSRNLSGTAPTNLEYLELRAGSYSTLTIDFTVPQKLGTDIGVVSVTDTFAPESARFNTVTDSGTVSLGLERLASSFRPVISEGDTGVVTGTDVASREIATEVYASDTGVVGASDITYEPTLVHYVADTDTVLGQDAALLNTAVYAEEPLVSDTLTVTSSEVMPIDPVVLPPNIDDYVTGQLGPIIYDFGMHCYDENKGYIGDAKEYLTSLSIDWDDTRTIKRTVKFSLADDSIHVHDDYFYEPYGIYKVFVPRINQTYDVEYRFGLYTGASYRHVIDMTRTTQEIEAYDLTVYLNQAVLSEIYTVPANSSYATIIRELCVDAGINELDITMPITSLLTPSPLTWEMGKTHLEVVRTLASAINWQEPFMNNDGKIVFQEMRDNYMQAADVTYATDHTSMIMPDIVHEHAVMKHVNKVIISVDDAMRTPFTVSYTNNNVENPTSVTNSGVVVLKLVEDLDFIANSTVAANRAFFICQKEAALHNTELKTYIDLRRKPREIYELLIMSPDHLDEPHIHSRWICTGWSMDFQAGGQMTHRLREIPPI